MWGPIALRDPGTVAMDTSYLRHPPKGPGQGSSHPVTSSAGAVLCLICISTVINFSPFVGLHKETHSSQPMVYSNKMWGLYGEFTHRYPTIFTFPHFYSSLYPFLDCLSMLSISKELQILLLFLYRSLPLYFVTSMSPNCETRGRSQILSLNL